MIFPRTIPAHTSKDYNEYKENLRRDFTNRCAYCLRHEHHFGGEANGQIDHFFPEAEFKALGQLEYSYTYSNLFWSCAECNQAKSYSWPDATEASLGLGFVDSTKENTDDHWEVSPTGELTALTPVGEYTIDIVLLWRLDLVRWRRGMLEAKTRIEEIKILLCDPNLTPQDKGELSLELRAKPFLFTPTLLIDRLEKKASTAITRRSRLK